jgi:hypothetical protein
MNTISARAGGDLTSWKNVDTVASAGRNHGVYPRTSVMIGNNDHVDAFRD